MILQQQLIRLVLVSLMLVLNFGCSAATSRVPYVPPEKLKDHVLSMGLKPTPNMVLVDTKKQTLAIIADNKVKKVYTISTSKKGLGQEVHSFKTPVGLHRINEKIGDGVPHYGIFHRRQYVGTTFKYPKLRSNHRKDYISTRILRLEGLQPGLNKGRDKYGKVIDTEERAVYIHGTTMEWKLGRPSTKGCVHMSAKDVVHFFNEIPSGTLVWIH